MPTQRLHASPGQLRPTNAAILALFDAPHTNARRSKLKSKNAACLAAKGKPDVEQIGSVYETVMGFTVEARPGPALAIRAGKNDRTPVFVDVAALAATRGGDEGSGTDEVPQGGG